MLPTLLGKVRRSFLRLDEMLREWSSKGAMPRKMALIGSETGSGFISDR
jgi:hypothetical protein